MSEKPIIYECGLGVYAEPWLEDRLAAALRAPAGPSQAGASAKDVTAVLTGGRLQTEPALPGPGHRLGDVREMLFDLPLGDAEAVREVSGRAARAGQHLDDPLPDGQSWIRPARHYSNSVGAMPYRSSRSNSSMRSLAVSCPSPDRTAPITRSIMGAA